MSSDKPSGGGPIVGIDLGTTNSLVAFADERGPRVLAAGGTNESPIVPSVVRYEPGEQPGRVRTVVGDDAKARATEFPLTTVSSVKRLMGRSVADAAADLPYLSYAVVEGEHDTARVSVPGLGEEGGAKVVSPQEVSAEILRALKARAEAALGEPVGRAVVTVPAYFDDAQRQATRDAGRIAGLEVVRIVNEPTAAALAYGLGLERSAQRNREPEVVAVYDLGGGTFDVSILRVIPGDDQGNGSGDADAGDLYQVLATAGDTRLGGDDVDQSLVRLFLDEMGLGADAMAGLPPQTRRALLRFAQDVKHKLSTEETAAVRIDTGGDSGPYERAVTRAEIEGLMTPWVDRTIAACERAVRDATKELMEGETVSRVVLVGGSTRVPLVRRRAGEFFGVEPYSALDPDTVVALGAAVQAGIVRRAIDGGPVEGGASGASGATSLLLDVIPLSLGIETRGGATAKLILRNSAVPAKATETFTTSEDNQTGIDLNVVQGEREMAADCRSLGRFALKGLPPMPAGVPQLDVEFLVDANGVLRVSAHERRSGKRVSVQIVPNHGLTEAEVDRMEAESLEHAADDMTRHRVVDLIENGRLDLKWITERLERHRPELDPAYAAELDGLVTRLRTLVDAAAEDWRSADANEIARAKDELDRGSVRLQEVGIAASLRSE